MRLLPLPPLPADPRDVFEHLRSSASVSLEEWCNLLGMRTRDYLGRSLADPHQREMAAARAAEFFSLSVDDVLEGRIDFRSIERDLEGDPQMSPEHLVGFSRVRTVITSLDALEDFWGWRARKMAMRRLGMTERFVSDPAREVSMKLVTDLCSHLSAEKSFDADRFYELGAYSVVANQNTELDRTYRSCRTPGEMYEHMWGDLLPLYELNTHYRALRLTSTGCRLQARTRPEAAELAGVKHLGSEGVCGYKAGLFASIPSYVGLSHSDVVEVQCVHRDGADSCIFDITFPEAITPRA
jgi:hypothetical protein